MSSNRRLVAFKYLLILSIVAILILIGVCPALVNAESALPYLELVRPDRGRVFAVTWSPHGSYVAVGTDTGLWIYTDTLADVLHVPDEPIHALAWSPDGTTIATGYFGRQDIFNETPDADPTHAILGGGLRMWSVPEDNGFFDVTPHSKMLSNGSTYALRFNPAGTALASLSQDKVVNYDYPYGRDTLHIYDPHTERLRYTFLMNDTPIIQNDNIVQGANGLAWTHDGRYLGIARGFGNASTNNLDTPSDQSSDTLFNRSVSSSVWDSQTNRFSVVDQVNGQVEAVGSVGWNNDDSQFATTTEQIRIPDSTSDIRYCEFPYNTVCYLPSTSQDSARLVDAFIPEQIQTLAWQPHGHWLAYDDQTRIRIYDTNTKKEVADLNVGRDSITMLEWSPDGSKLLSSGSDYAVRIWNRFESYTAPDPTPITNVNIPSLTTTSSISPDGQWILNTDPLSGRVQVIGANDNLVKLMFSVAPLYGEYEQVHPVYPYQDTFSNSLTHYFAWTAQSDLLVTDGPRYSVWSVKNGFRTGYLNLSPPAGITLRPDNNAYLDAHYDEISTFLAFSVIDVNTKKVIAQTTPTNTWHNSIRVLGSAFTNYSDSIYLGQWSPDGRLIAFNDDRTGGQSPDVYIVLWDTKTNSFPVAIDLHRTIDNGTWGSAYVSAWSPDGTLIAVEGYDVLYLYRLAWIGNVLSAKLVFQRPHKYESGSDNGVKFSPDNRYLFFDDTIWDTTTLFPVFRFHEPSSYDDATWSGDTLSLFLRTWSDQNGNTLPGYVITYRTSDFLPKP